MKKVSIVAKNFLDKSETGIIIIVVVYAIFVQTINGNFLSFNNIMNFLRQGGYILVAGIGMTLVLIAGGLDLSIGSVMAMAGVATGYAMKSFELPIIIAILIGVVVGVIFGLFNGYIIMKFKLPPMIMTLGTMYIVRGIVTVITKGVSVYPLPEAFKSIEQSDIFGVPMVVFYAMILSFICHFILTRTSFGRSVYAIGGNKETAKLSGININKVTVIVYMICGVTAALTGIIFASRLGTANPGDGKGFEMSVIAACIIGGTSTFGGKGTILGTALGAIFMSMITNSMMLMKINVNYQNLAVGAVLVIAVILDQLKRDISSKRDIKTMSIHKKPNEVGNG